eukprot:2556959-Pyramimonas_sp.AAC.1
MEEKGTFITLGAKRVTLPRRSRQSTASIMRALKRVCTGYLGVWRNAWEPRPGQHQRRRKAVKARTG